MSKWLTLALLGCCISATTWANTDDDVRDPTAPLGYIAATGGEPQQYKLELNSVLISSQRRLAIINGNNVREGQVVPGTNGIKVQRILPQRVVLQQSGKAWTITMSPDVVKKH